MLKIIKITHSPENVIPPNTITVTMEVQNTEAFPGLGDTAIDVIPELILSGTDTEKLVLISGPIPTSAILDGGKTQNFEWKYTPAKSGAVRVTGRIEGKDHFNNNKLIQLEEVIHIVDIKEVRYTSEMSINKTIVSEGQTVRITMNVTNNGNAKFLDIKPTLAFKDQNKPGSLTIIPDENLVSSSTSNIDPQKKGTYVWDYTTKSGDPRTIIFIEELLGTDEVGQPISIKAESKPLTIQTPAKLMVRYFNASGPNSDKDYLSKGQDITISMTIENIGEAAANEVKPIFNPLRGKWTLKNQSPQANIPGGASFDFSGSGNTELIDSGPIQFGGKAIGKDANSGMEVSTEEAISNELIIQKPAALKCEIINTPKEITTNQSFAIILEVKNIGEANATEIIPELGIKAATADLESDIRNKIEILNLNAMPFGILQGNGAHQFKYDCKTEASLPKGKFQFTASVSGKDENTGLSSNSTYSTCQSGDINIVETALKCEIRFDPQQDVTKDDNLTVKMDVTNVGSAIVKDIKPSVLAGLPSNTGKATLKSGPLPDRVESLEIQKTATFSWIYTADAEGDFGLSGLAKGSDAVSTKESNLSETTPIRIVKPPSAKITLAVSKDNVNAGQSFSVTALVINDGGVSLKNFKLEIPTIALGSTGKASAKTGSIAQIIDLLKVNDKITKSWEFTGDASGQCFFVLTGAGTNEINNKEYKTNSNQAAVTIKLRASIRIRSLSAENKDNNYPSQVNVDQDITVTMVVENTGDSTANNVKLTLTPSNENIVTLKSGPTPESYNISKEQTFIWLYRATRSGPINFKGFAIGVDANDPNNILKAELESKEVKIQNPANIRIRSLSAENKDNKYPGQVNVDQDITVTMVVENTGDSTANNVKPTLTPSNENIVTLKSGPTPESYSISKEQTFIWIYKATKSGTISFAGTAIGVDATDPNNIPKAGSAVSSPIKIQTIPKIVINNLKATKIDAPEFEAIGINQRFNFTFTVENIGEANAKITPSRNDLSITSDQFGIVEPQAIEISGKSSNNKLQYEIRTLPEKTASGTLTLNIENLNIIDVNSNKTVAYDKPSGIPITIDMVKPILSSVNYNDKISNGKVEQGDELILEFSEEIMVSANTDSDDFFVVPKKIDPFGVSPNISVNKNLVVITLGENPEINPAGIYTEEPLASGIGLQVKERHIADKAGNVPESIAKDIGIVDNNPPIIKILSISNKTTSSMPIFILIVNDSSSGFSSGINIDTIEFWIDGNIIDTKRINIKERPNLDESDKKILKNISEGDIALEVAFKEPLSKAGTHTIVVTVKDKKGNEAKGEAIFTSMEPMKAKIIDLATYPNPASVGSDITIRYVLSSEESEVAINIYDVAGRLVRRFDKIQGKVDRNEITWNGKTEMGDSLSTGIYICELIIGENHKYWRIAIGPTLKSKGE